MRENEMWVERVMQMIKGPIKYRLSTHPEKLFVNMYQLRQAVSRMKLAHSELKSLEEIMDQLTRHSKSYDVLEDSEESIRVQFIGAGRKISEAQKELTQQQAWQQVYKEYTQDLQAAGWTQELLLSAEAEVQELSRASID